MALDVRVTGADVMAQVGARLRKAANGGELKRELAAAIREVTKPIVSDVQDAVRNVHSNAHGSGGGSVARHRHAVTSRNGKTTSRSVARSGQRSGLRETIAGAVIARARISGPHAGVRIQVDTDKLPPDQRKLPAYLDSRKGWRHPVYGNRNNWVTQTGQPWFQTTIEKHLDEARAAILRAVEHTLTKLEEG